MGTRDTKKDTAGNVQQLLRETPGISIDQQDMLIEGIATGLIPSKFPPVAGMLQELKEQGLLQLTLVAEEFAQDCELVLDREAKLILQSVYLRNILVVRVLGDDLQ